MEDFNQLFDDDLFNIDKAEDKTIKLKEGERRMVSILFADIKGFTSLSESLDHEEVQSLMDQLMKIFSHSVDVHGGYVDKYTGDQIMALFGAKQASEVDTQRAINTGLDMLTKLNKFNAILKNSPKYKDFTIDLSIRVGINTGMVTTGAIGKEREGDYTVYGDTVNLASRMESNAPTNTIMVPESTMILVENSFEFKDNGEIKVKGKSLPISVFLVKSKKDIEVKHSTPFIGRDKELQIMNRSYNQAIKNLKNNDFNKVNFIASVADAGVGKSRLVYEFIQNNSNIQTENSFSIAHASNISSQPYYLFITLLKDIFKISEVDSLEDTKDKLEKGIQDIESITGESLSSALPFIGFLLGIKYDDDRLKDREEIQNHINISYRKLLESVCQFTNTNNKPYIFVLEDLHWVDKMSMDLLIFLASTFDLKNKNKNKNKAYPLFMSTYRSNFNLPKELISELEFSELKLEPLTKEDSLDLISFLTKDVDIEDDKKLELFEKSKGNPFFIEEWVSLVKESKTYGEVVEESRGISHAYKIPNTINALILARIDGLEKSLKALLQKATIIGEDFFLQILSKLEDKLGYDKHIDKSVHSLEDENFIQHFINQLDHYKFKHILTRDVAYSTILKSNKKILHQTVAEVIEENFKDKIELFYFDLAIHYDMSDDHKKAIKYLLLAGDKNILLFDYVHGEQCYKRVVSIIENNTAYTTAIKSINDKNCDEKDKLIIDNLMLSKGKLAKIYINIGKWDKALEILNEIKNKLLNANNATKFNIYFDLGKINAIKRNHEDGIKYFKQSLEIATNVKKLKHQALCIGELAHLAFDLGNIEPALKGFNQELKIFKGLDDQLNMSIAYGHLGMYYLQNGDMDSALSYFKKKYDISSKHDSKQQILMALGNISLIHNIRGEYSQSLEYFKEVLDISEDINDIRSQAMTYGNQGIIYKNQQRFELSLENYNKQLELSVKLGDPWIQSNAYDGIGLVYQKLSRFKESVSESLKSLKIKEDIKDKNGYASTLGNLSSTYIKMGELDKAQKSLNESIDIFKNLKNIRSEHLASIELSKVLIFNDKLNESINYLKNALEYFKSINDIPYLVDTAILLSKIYRQLNQNNKAKTLLKTSEDNVKILKNNNIEIQIAVENGIFELLDTKSNKTLDSILNTEISDELTAYIYYNIGIINSDGKTLSKSKLLYTKLYNKYNDYSYKYYLDKIK